MKVAFATQDQQCVDAHFGWAKHLAVYDVTPEGHAFVQDFGFGDDLAEDGNEDKLAPKLEAIKDCAIVYVAAIGGSAAARVGCTASAESFCAAAASSAAVTAAPFTVMRSASGACPAR